MKDSKPVTVGILVGLLLVVIFAVGLACAQNPGALRNEHIQSFALNQLCDFCAAHWIPAGAVGVPLLLVCTIVSLVRERKRNKAERPE